MTTPPTGRSSHDGNVLSDREAVERVIRMLKRTPLFAHMSWRLLADLVAAFPLRHVGDATDPMHLDFAVLAVPEHRLFLSDAAYEHDPLTRVGPTERDRVAELASGIHMRHQSHVRRVVSPEATPKVEAARDRRTRYYALERREIARLPVHVTRAMNFGAFRAEDIQQLVLPEDVDDFLPEDFEDIL